MSSAAPLRIGVVGPRGIGAFQGGIERYCSEFYPHLPAEMFEVTIFVRNRSTLPQAYRHIQIVKLAVPRSRSLETVVYTLLAVVAARLKGINTLHVHGITACLSLPLARLLGMRAIVRHVGADYDRSKWSSLGRHVLRFAEQLCARHAETVVCLTPHIAAEFARATGRRDALVIPNGVPECDAGEYVGAGEPDYVLAVGRLVPEKNFDRLVEAFLSADLPKTVRLVLVGTADYNGPYARALDALCARDADRIVRLGPVFGDALQRLYSRARLFCLPSDHEGMSFALLEAGIAGAVVIASDIPANRAVCVGFGRLYPVDSTSALRAALEEEWRRPRSADERLTQIELCRRRFDWSDIAQAMAPILKGEQPTAPYATGAKVTSQ